MRLHLSINIVILVTLLTAMLGMPAVWADDEGQVVGTQCWEKGVLVGGYDKYHKCDVTGGGGDAIIMGPPVIVWVHPSAEGSQMPGLSQVDSNLVNQLSAIADTPITLRQKGEFAMRNGDLAKAKAYLDEANRRAPQDAQIQESLRKLQNLFDNGSASLIVPRLQLSKQEFLKPIPAQTVDKYISNPEFKALRDAEIISYNQLANADAAFNTMMNKVKTGGATQSDVDQAQSKLNAAVEDFKKAESKLKEKIYVLDQ